MTTPPAPGELRRLLFAWGESDGAPSARAAMHVLLFDSLTDAPGFARHVHVDHVRTAGGLVHCAWIEDWDELIGDRELRLSGIQWRMVRLAASLATGRPVSLFEDLTVGLGPAHAGRIAEAVLIAAGEAGTVTVDGLAKPGPPYLHRSSVAHVNRGLAVPGARGKPAWRSTLGV